MMYLHLLLHFFDTFRLMESFEFTLRELRWFWLRLCSLWWIFIQGWRVKAHEVFRAFLVIWFLFWLDAHRYVWRWSHWWDCLALAYQRRQIIRGRTWPKWCASYDLLFKSDDVGLLTIKLRCEPPSFDLTRMIRMHLHHRSQSLEAFGSSMMIYLGIMAIGQGSAIVQ